MLHKRLRFHFRIRKDGCREKQNDKRRSRHRSSAARELSCGKILFGGATWAGERSSSTTAASRSMRLRTLPKSCCRISLPITKARKASGNLPHGKRCGTRQNQTKTAAAKMPPDNRYMKIWRGIYSWNSTAKGMAVCHPLCVFVQFS